MTRVKAAIGRSPSADQPGAADLSNPLRRMRATVLPILVLMSTPLAAKTPDFDGDGTVALGDFFLFVDAFGQTVDGSNQTFDLNDDSAIDLSDFFLFVDRFGDEIPGEELESWVPVPLRSTEQRAAGIAGGEGMQLIYGLAYAPSNPLVVYLVTDVSQVWKSYDGGATWRMKNSGFLANGGLSVVVDPNDANVAFVAASTHEELSDDFADGIYRTTDGGETWQQVRRTPYVTLLESKGGVHFAFASSAVIYAATHEEGLLRSRDGGDSWQAVGDLAQTKLLDVRMDPADTAKVFVATEAGLNRYSNDTGSDQWIGSGLPDFPRAVAVRPDDPQVLYATAGKFGVYRSSDGGATFSPANEGLVPVDSDTSMNWHATYLTLSPADPDRLYVSFFELGDNQPYYSRDGGDSWLRPASLDTVISSVNDAYGGEFLASPIAVHPTNPGEALASGNGNNVQKTTDGGATWIYSGSGYSGGRIGAGSTAFGWDLNDPARFAFFLVDYGAVLSEDGGETFRNLRVPRLDGGATTNVGALDPTPGSRRIIAAVGITSMALALFDDESKAWSHLPGTERASYEFLAYHPQNPAIVYAGDRRSNDRGKTWTTLSKEIDAVFAGDGDIVYAAESTGEEVTVSKSADGGSSWSTPYDPIGIPESFEMAVAPDDADRVYVTSGLFGLFIWDGERWLEKGDADGLEMDRFESVSTRFVTIDPVDPNVVYAGNWIAFRGHSNGVFRSRNAGVDWENITAGLGAEFTPWALSVKRYCQMLWMKVVRPLGVMGPWKRAYPGDPWV